MLGFCGILRFDGQPIDSQKLLACTFQSPKWQADHQEFFLQDSFGLVSTQRFITPECPLAPQPYQHPESGCVIIADAYLTNRQELISALAIDKNSADCQLIMAAYLKWGKNCTQYFAGAFLIAICNLQQQTLFLATDHLSQRPCFYAYQPGSYIIIANTMQPFRLLCPALTINDTLFINFSLDAHAIGHTCYKEVNKLPAAHYALITASTFETQAYWQLKKQKHAFAYPDREDYYQAFRELFSTTVKRYLRSPFPISTQLSGGLNSSAVTAVAAQACLEHQQPLYSFTATSQTLSGPSYKELGCYQEIPRIQALLDQFPSIMHTLYSTSDEFDLLETLNDFYPLMAYPYKNLSHLDWALTGLEHANALNSRIMLNAQAGKHTISWHGRDYKNLFLSKFPAIKHPFKANNLARHPYLNANLTSKKPLGQPRVFNHCYHQSLLLGTLTAHDYSLEALNSLWFGVAQLDPTADIKLVEFCYNVPQWVYSKGKKPLQKRLLAREGLIGIVPEAIRYNLQSGELALDGYLQYNRYAQQWRKKILEITHYQPHALLWRLYNREKILHLFQKYPVLHAPTTTSVFDIYDNLLPCLSLGFYLDFLEHG